MIRTIQNITDFGVFGDFQWSAGLPEFKRYNLLYGWNYSGKTTLSRAFRCFELKQTHSDFASALVQLKTEDGAVHHLSAPQSAPECRVFNSDFVRENLGCESGSPEPILVLGATDMAKQGTLNAKEAERDALIVSREASARKRDEKRTSIDRGLTTYARDLIKNPLGVPSYDKTRFEPKVNALKDGPDSHLLEDEKVEEYLAIFRSVDKKPALTAKLASFTSVAALREAASVLLTKTVGADKSIARLKVNPVLERWVSEGRPLHQGQDSCQFCGQQLPTDLMAHLAEHFSAEYEGLIAQLIALKGRIQLAQKEGIELYHQADFYSQFSAEYLAQKGNLEELLSQRNAALNILAEAVEGKLTKAFASVECPVIDDPLDHISTAVAAINKTIIAHNARTTEFDQRRADAFSKLESHYAASFVRHGQYNEQLAEIAELAVTHTQQRQKVEELDGEIRTLEQELSEAAKGAGRINDLLAAYFGKNDLRITVAADKRFQIIRAGIVAKNLSEGEKTAIAFAYFITRIQDGRHPIDQTIVVIDDPISSLDANHLFNTYALIKTQLAGCRQLFISTHSFEFYNLIREWTSENEDVRKPQANWKHWGVFLVRRKDDGKAVLEEIPKELLKFKSEYHYLFSTLYHFDKATAANFDSLLSLLNVVRRFMEAFGGIMIPLSKGLNRKMERLFANEVERERVWKFINHYSHNTTITRSLVIPDTAECKDIVRACLGAVEAWDSDYYQDMISEVQ